jgi:internalin A
MLLIVSSCGLNSHRILNGDNDQSSGSASTLSITSPNNGISFRTKAANSVTISGICEKGVAVALATTPVRTVTNNCTTDGTWSFESGTLTSGANTFSIAAEGTISAQMTITADLAYSFAIIADNSTINVGETANLHVAFYDINGAEIVVPNVTSPHLLVWTNDDTPIAALNPLTTPASGEKATVTGESVGSAVIHVSLTQMDSAYNYQGNQTSEITINVTNAPAPAPVPGVAASMKILANTQTIDCTPSVTCNAQDIANLSIHFYDAFGAEIVIPEGTSPHTISWISDTPSIATVLASSLPLSGEDAVVTGVAGGTTDITADLTSIPVSYGYIGNMTASLEITVIGPPPVLPPVVTGVSPSLGYSANTTSVTITGTSLSNATSVNIGSVSMAISNDSDTQITATVPAGLTAGTYDITVTTAAGTYDITVTTAAGTSTTSIADNFTVSSATPPPTCTVVNFPDVNLNAVIRSAIGKPIGDICQEDLVSLTGLYAYGQVIMNLTGLEHCTNLTYLELGWNYYISDLSPLAGITNLAYLDLRGNNISDITALTDLTNLTYLDLSDNNYIRDITALTGMTQLTYLDLHDNQVGDINPLTELTNLTYLNLYNNQIVDTTPLAGLMNLTATSMNLGWNKITNLNGLRTHTNLTYLALYYNQISDLSPLAGLTNLTYLDLSDNNYIRDITALTGMTQLTYLDLHDNQVGDISPLTELTNLTYLNLYNDQIVDTTPLAGLMNLPTSMNLGWNKITNLSGLATHTNLTYLNLMWNNISDLSPLTGLTNLTYLDLHDNNYIRDIAALTGMTQLTYLDLHDNQVGDISPLTELTNLTYLNLYDNQIVDTTPLAGLMNLTATGLNLSWNNIANLNGLKTHTNFTYLFLDYNQITDLSPLAGLTNLTDLEIRDNNISDITALTGMTQLTYLDLYDNQISDISALVANFNSNGLIGATIYLQANPLDTQAITDANTLLSGGVNISW